MLFSKRDLRFTILMGPGVSVGSGGGGGDANHRCELCPSASLVLNSLKTFRRPSFRISSSGTFIFAKPRTNLSQMTGSTPFLSLMILINSNSDQICNMRGGDCFVFIHWLTRLVPFHNIGISFYSV